jgi:PAS domain S-box-containing protein
MSSLHSHRDPSSLPPPNQTFRPAETSGNTGNSWADGLSNHGYRALVEHSLIGVAVIQDGRLVYLNARMAEIVGYDRKQISAMDSIFEFIHPDDHDLVRDQIGRRLSGELTDTRYRFRMMHSSGRVVHVEVHGSISTYRGRPAIISSVHDVTEQLKTIERLRESERRFRLMAENAKDFIFRYRIHPDREFEYVSPSASRTMGYEPADFYRDPDLILRLVHRADRDVLTHLYRGERLPENKATLRIRRNDGAFIWTELHVSPVTDETGAVVAVEGIGRDITRRIEAQENGRRLTAAVEAAANAVVITDPNGRIEWVNPAFTRLTGYTREEAVGNTPALLNSGRHDEPFYRELWETITSGSVWRGQVVNRRRNGEEYTEEMTITPVRDRTGQVASFIAVKQDVTDRILYQKGLIEARERAEEMARTKNSLLNNLSHELRTPLTVILGFSQLLLKEVPDHLYEFAYEVHSGGRRLKDTFESVLSLAQLEANGVSLQPEMVALLEEARDIAGNYRLRLEEKGIDWMVSGDDDLVCVDRMIASRILHNLISNAVKFTDSGSVAIEIEAGSSDVTLRVSDTGQGISEAFLPHIFEEFRQESDGLQRSHDGTGLGLTIVRKLVELHRGRIGVQSAQGVGTTFTVVLPNAGCEQESAQNAAFGEPTI